MYFNYGERCPRGNIVVSISKKDFATSWFAEDPYCTGQYQSQCVSVMIPQSNILMFQHEWEWCKFAPCGWNKEEVWKNKCFCTASARSFLLCFLAQLAVHSCDGFCLVCSGDPCLISTKNENTSSFHAECCTTFRDSTGESRMHFVILCL